MRNSKLRIVLAFMLAAMPAGVANGNPYQELWEQYAEPMAVVREAVQRSGQVIDLTWRPDDPALLVALATPGLLDAIVEATKTESPDWSEQPSKSDRLTIVVSTARVLCADLRAALSEGDADRAVDRAKALWRFAEQHRGERLLVDATLCVALASTASVETRALAKSAALTSEQIGSILQAAAWIDGSDPFGFRAALQQEPRVLAAQLLEGRGGVHEDRRLVDDEGRLIGDEDREAERVIDEFLASMGRGIADSFREAERHWDEPDARDRLEELDRRTEQAAFFGVSLLPSFNSHWRTEQSGLDHAKMAREALTESRKD